MSEAKNIDEIRRASLDRIDRTEKHYKAAFFGAAILELFFLAGFLMLADFKSNRMHLLLFLATIAIYSIVMLGLVALGSLANRNALRILKALESLESRIASNR
jgi:hypothetical protein